VPPERDTRDPEKYALIMKELVKIFDKNGIKRYIHIGGAVHGGGENENWTFKRRLLRAFLNLMWKPGLIAKQLEWEVLQKSQLDWTLIRPPRIGQGKSKAEIVADEKNLASLEIKVEDLAEFMLKQIESNEWIKKAPLVANRKHGIEHVR
jgi:hypothetical protein